jgi:hydrogenase maturation protein HypF
LHYLLFFHERPSPEVLVMTSGNISEEPICFENEEAMERLGNIADYFLLHDRGIFMRCDDSVARVFAGKERIIRRARGYVPIPIKMDFNFKRSIFGCGADLKNTFCMAKGNRAILSHHIGDMENLETLNSYELGIKHFEKFLEFRPEIIAHDMHPEYYSTKYALEREGEKIQVQHHHAHIASCMAENNLMEKVVGVAFDGTGYGADGKMWGGEFLVCDWEHFERKAHLEYIPLLGGEKAIKQPWRMSFSYLYKIYGEEFLNHDFGFLSFLDDKKIEILKNMLDKGINSPLTSSMGRLFDAVSSIVNPKYEITYEGQAAAEFEQVSSDKGDYSVYDYEVKKENKIFSINVKSVIVGVVEDLGKISAGEISRRFHLTVASLVKDVCLRIAEEEDIRNVVLSGGVFQNFTLLEMLHELLPSSGLNLYLHSKVPPNDGGISLGQVVIANSKCG